MNHWEADWMGMTRLAVERSTILPEDGMSLPKAEKENRMAEAETTLCPDE